VVVPAEKTPTGPVPVKLRLVNGVEINAFKGGVEDQLVACMNDDKCVAGKERWFDFDNINFQSGSSKLTESSSVQVKNIVEILKAYPNARIKIGGYTDAVGKAEDNLKLSQRRAEAVTTAIREGGANKAQLLGAEGYGSKFAKVPATASDEERKVDRRISISLRGK
jgi:outer membrane protein OmpA-like peptidoglycan-associated protein